MKFLSLFALLNKLNPSCCDYLITLSARYVTKDAAAAHNEWVAEQEAIAAAEAAAEDDAYYETIDGEYEYYETDDGEYEYEECLMCDEEGEYYDEDPAPRFFFSQISQIFDTRDLPCCKESDIRQTETTTEPTGPR